MGTTDIGAQLRSSREACGLSIASLAQRTRVQPRIIVAIEQNDLAAIPPKPYGRGFIRTYAREVGLDPEQTVREYFAQFASVVVEPPSTPQPQPWPARGSGLLTVGIVVAGLVLLASFQRSDTDVVDTRAPVPVGTSGSEAEPPESAGTAALDATRASQALREPNSVERASAKGTLPRAGSALALVLEAERDCWVTARADGKRVLYQLLRPGMTHTVHADQEVLLRAGDAGALRVAINGGPEELFGADGEVRTARITLEGATTAGR